jgi:hypothetical protein
MTPVVLLYLLYRLLHTPCCLGRSPLIFMCRPLLCPKRHGRLYLGLNRTNVSVVSFGGAVTAKPGFIDTVNTTHSSHVHNGQECGRVVQKSYLTNRRRSKGSFYQSFIYQTTHYTTTANCRRMCDSTQCMCFTIDQRFSELSPCLNPEAACWCKIAVALKIVLCATILLHIRRGSGMPVKIP